MIRLIIISLVLASFIPCSIAKEGKQTVNQEYYYQLSFVYERRYAETFLNMDFMGEVFLLTEDGLIKVQNSATTEYYINPEYGDLYGYKIFLIDSNFNNYYVAVWNSDIEYIGTGFISKETPLAIFPKNNTVVYKLYEKPDTESEYRLVDMRDQPGQLEVVDFYYKWLKVKVIIQGKYHNLWMRPEDQCGNIYSACN